MFKILVVEDDKDLNKTVCSFLNHSGYETIGCLNANDAYDALGKMVEMPSFLCIYCKLTFQKHFLNKMQTTGSYDRYIRCGIQINAQIKNR